MKLIINGQKKDIECNSVSELIGKLGLDKDMVALELNKNIVHRQDFENTTLNNNDKVEIVKVVGGG